jgi:hypothetical protein
MTISDSKDLGRESARNRAARIIAEKPLIQGSLVESLRTCGTSGCRCHSKGPKHSAVYLSVRRNEKRDMICVPETVLPYVEECVANHQNLQKTLEIISRDCIEVFLLKKRGPKKARRQR